MLMEFLGYFPGYMVQTFDDREYVEKDNSLTILLNGDMVSQEELRNLNSMGAGIFFTPNQFEGSRKKTSCLGINAWFMECDNLTKEGQMEMIKASPLEPSFIVETNKSLHTYWLAQSANIENFEIIQRRLIYNFQADEAIKDCSRVMRIPGFMHNKNFPGFPVKLIHSKPENRYTEQQMLDAFKGAPKVAKKYKNIWEAMGDLDSKTVLSRLSGDPIVSGHTIIFKPRPTGGEHIYVNDKPADAWLDIEGRIGAPKGKNGGPTWIQWVKFYGREPREIYAWAMTHLADLLPDVKKDLTVSDLQFEKMFSIKKTFDWSVGKLNEHATVLQQEQYVVLAGETGSGKTTLALQMAIENSREHRVLYLSLEMSNEALMMRYALLMLGISAKDWQMGKFSKEVVMSVINAIPRNLHFMELGDVNINEIKKVITEGAYDLVFIDNFGFVDGQGRDKNEKMENISRTLKWLANETGTCIVALHHFRKKAGDKSVIRSMDSLLGSSKISHDANIVMQVIRNMEDNATEEQKEEAFIVIQKDRDFGITGGYKIKFNQGRYI